MKIGIFCPTFNVYGGGELVTAVIANTLAKRDYDVILFTNEETTQRQVEKFFGIRLHPSIKAVVAPSIIQSNELLGFYQTILRSYNFKLKCDILLDAYSNCIFPWTSICYIHYPLQNHYFYRLKFPYLKSRRIRAIGALPYVILEKYLINEEGKLILANSYYTAEEIREFSGKKAIVLYPPILHAHFNKNVDEQRKNIVVTISRFAYSKQLEKILNIASLTTNDVQFALIGRVHNKNTLLFLQKLTDKLGLKERVKFLPDISRFEMQQILKQAKIYLHTMEGEHFGISIVEAMASGCIPIVHDSGGPKEFIPDELRYKNIEEAAEKVNKEIYEWRQDKAQQMIKIAEQFSEEKFSEKFMQLFQIYLENLKNNFK